MKKLIITYLSIIVASLTAQAQTADTPNWVALETQLRNLLKAIALQSSYSVRDSLNAIFVTDFERTLRLPGAFSHPFDSLPHMGRLVSDDGLVRIFTWNIPQADGSQHFFGYIQHREPKNPIATTHALHNHADTLPPDRLLNAQLPHTTWFGALYYQIVTIKTKASTYYVLLGYRPNGLHTSKKVIEPLSFGLSGQPLFGQRVFNVNGKQQLQRIIFEFSARASMTLRFEPTIEMLVFDHLSPASPRYAGNAQFYGPDFSYDGFKLDTKSGFWSYVRDLDMRNPRKNKRSKNTGPASDPPFIYKPNYKQAEK